MVCGWIKATRCANVSSIIGVSVSEPLPSDVNVNFVCLSVCLSVVDGVRHGNGACVSFLHVAVYVTMVTLFRQSIDSTHLRGT